MFDGTDARVAPSAPVEPRRPPPTPTSRPAAPSPPTKASSSPPPPRASPPPRPPCAAHPRPPARHTAEVAGDWDTPAPDPRPDHHAGAAERVGTVDRPRPAPPD